MNCLFLLTLLLAPLAPVWASGVMSPELAKLEQKLTATQDAKKKGMVSPEQYQSFLSEFRPKLAEALTQAPHSSVNTLAHARILVLLGEQGEAVARLNHALEERPDDSTLRLALGQTALDRNDYTSALAAANEVLKTDPADKRALFLKHQSLGRVAPSEGGGQTNPAPLVTTPNAGTTVALTNPGKHKIRAADVPEMAGETPVPKDGKPLPLWPLAVPVGIGLVGYGIYRNQRTTWGANEELNKPAELTTGQIAKNRKKLKVAAASVAIGFGLIYAAPPILEVAAPVVMAAFSRSGQSLQHVAASESGAIMPEVSAAASEVSVMQKLPWGTWGSYAKTIYQGRTYAQIGNRLYTEHAIERMLPRGLATQGRSVSPTFVEEIIKTGQRFEVLMEEGVRRTIYRSGNLEVVTEQNGLIIVTVKRVGSK